MTVTGGGFGPWAPLPIPELARTLAPARFLWWVAGGYALELFLGRTIRSHGDLDIEVPRRDQHTVRRLLAGQSWELHIAAAGDLHPWRQGEELPSGAHSVWCRPAPAAPWCLQVLFADTDNGNWVFRRNPAITQPLETIGRRTPDGVPYLAPAIQLLFKARNFLPKDLVDFDAVLGELGDTDRAWLMDALAMAYPGHPWLARLHASANP